MSKMPNIDLDNPDMRPRFGASFGGALSFKNIIHRYDKEDVLDDLSLSVMPGEILCLLGESGCGKSTLLKIAAGIEHQRSGTLELDDILLADENNFTPPEKRGIGLVFQDYALFPHMSVLENVMFGLRRLTKKEAKAQAQIALRSVRLEAYENTSPARLSGGEQQRVALARALVPRPNVLLLDEPFSNLDRLMRESVRDATISALRSARTTSIIVTHDAEEAMRIGDRIALMHKGRLVQLGTPHELYRKPESLLSARYFGSLNEIEGVCQGGQVVTPIGTVPNSSNLSDGNCVVCIRPEGFLIDEPKEGMLKGRILRHQFLGSVDQFEIAVENIHQTLVARIRPELTLNPGDDISIRILPLETLVFRPNIS